MKFHSKQIVFTTLLLTSFFGFTQTTKLENKIPKSIYFLNSENSNYQFSAFKLHSKLNLKTYRFLQVNNKYYKNGQLNIYAETFYVKPSQLVFDSYKKLKEKEYLEKSFFKVSSLYDLPRNHKNI